MKAYEWKLDPSYDALVIADKSETGPFLGRVSDLYNENNFSSGRDYYFLVNFKGNYFSLLPQLDLIYNYDSVPPFGQELKDLKLDLDHLKYRSYARVELPKREEMLGIFIGDAASSRYKYRHSPGQLHIADVFDLASETSGISIMYLAALQSLSSQVKIQFRDLGSEETQELQDTYRNLLRYYGRLYGVKGFCDALLRWIYASSRRRLSDDNLQLALCGVAAGWIGKTQDIAGKLGECLCSAISDNEQVIKAAGAIAQALYCYRNGLSTAAVMESLKQVSSPGPAVSKTLKIMELVENAPSFNSAITTSIALSNQPNETALAAALAEAKMKASQYTRTNTIRHISNPMVNDIYEVFLNIDRMFQKAEHLSLEE